MCVPGKGEPISFTGFHSLYWLLFHKQEFIFLVPILCPSSQYGMQEKGISYGHTPHGPSNKAK